MERATTQNPPMTYAIGDLHGEITQLRRLLSLLSLRSEDTLVFLGDYLDRGEDSVATILALRELKRSHPACIFLRGNHEDAWLSFWNGTRFTHPPDIAGALQLWDDHDGALPFAIGDWLEQTCIEYEDEHAYYVHAALLPGRPPAKTPDFYKMWGVRGFLESSYDWGKPVITGHWNLSEPLVRTNKIVIDTGAYHTGKLTAVRLPDRQIFQVEREDP